MTSSEVTHLADPKEIRAVAERLEEQVASMNRALIGAGVGDSSPYDGTSNIEEAAVALRQAADEIEELQKSNKHLHTLIDILDGEE